MIEALSSPLFHMPGLITAANAVVESGPKEGKTTPGKGIHRGVLANDSSTNAVDLLAEELLIRA